MTSAAQWWRWPKRAGWLLGAVLICGGVWIVATALLARSQLEYARTSVADVQSALIDGNASEATHAITGLQQHATRAHELTTGPAWWVASQIPVAGAPLRTMRGIATEVDAIGAAAPPGADLSLAALRVSTDTIDLAAVKRLAPYLQRLASAAATARDQVDSLPASTWLSPVDSAREQFAGLLKTEASTIEAASTATNVLPTMLGETSPKRYLVAFENEAEMRGTGGLAGAFAILNADKGRITVGQILADGALDGVQIPQSTASDLVAAWNGQPFDFFVDGNESAHFPYAGRVWSAYWQKYSGQRLDGVLALDPTAVSYLLNATGGGALSTGDTIDAANVVDFTQRDLYARYPLLGQTDARERILVDVAKLVSTKVLSGSGSVAGVLQALSHAASDGRLLAWSAEPAVQDQIAGHRIAGAIPDSPAPYSQVVMNNAAGGKLDYYLDRSISVIRSGCGKTRSVTVTVTLTNTAPSTGLGQYAEAVSTSGLPPGGNRWYVDYVATRGAQIRGVEFDGRPVATTAFTEHAGHPFFREKVTVLSGQSVTLTYHLLEPDTGPLNVVAQPGIRPLQLVTDDRTCT